MAAVPSIKGSIFAVVVEDAGKLLARNELERRELSRWLEASDVALLGQKILPSDWYDIRAYRRFAELLRDVEGGGSNDYLRQAGKRTARRLLEAGLYAQLRYLHRTEKEQASDPQARYEAFGRDLRLLTTISSSTLNFTRWEVTPDPEFRGRYRIDVHEAGALPEVFCWRCEGFVNEMATQHGDPDLWRFERIAPDRVAYRMIRSI